MKQWKTMDMQADTSETETKATSHREPVINAERMSSYINPETQGHEVKQDKNTGGSQLQNKTENKRRQNTNLPEL